MAKIMSSLILTLLMVLSIGKVSAAHDANISLSPAEGHHMFVHPLTQAISRAHQPEAFSHLNMTAMLRDALSDLLSIQAGLLLDHSPTQKLQLMSKYLEIFKDVQSELNSPCLDDTARIITSWFRKNESWSYQFLDATGKPNPGLTLFHVNFVGDYNQCKAARAPPSLQNGKPGFQGKYCTLMGRPPGDYVLPIGVKLGSCMPDSCNETELTLLIDRILRKMTNGSLVAGPTECHTDDRKATAATVVATTVLTIILGLVLCGTVVDIVFIQRPKWLKEAEETNLLTNPEHGSQADDDEKLLGQNDKDETGLLPRKYSPTISVWGQILVSFSIYTNASKALSTSQPVGSLGAVHGIRFLSMSWVMLCHVFAFGAFFFENIDMFPNLLKRWTFTVIANGFVSVDTFFTLSGLLTAYLTCQHMKKVGWKLNWGLYYFHRFWRLTPPYMLILLMVLGFQQYLGRGALWEEVQPTDKENCENYWWANLFYVNNLLKAGKMCFAHSWYLSNDMQFFFISPLLLIPFCFKIIYGLAACLIFLLVTVITTAVLSVHNEWSVTMVSEQSMTLIGQWFEDYYIKPWCRLGPYVIGILTGMMLAHYRRIRLPKYGVFLGWTLAIAIGLAVVYGIHGDLSGDHPSTVGLAAFYNSVSRSAWAACVCWVIVACASGYGGFVNTLLSWSPFVVLGRLTYVAYLIHPSVFLIYYQNREQVFYYTDTNVAVAFCGLLVCTNLIAFVVMLLFESPMIALEKVLLPRKHSSR